MLALHCLCTAKVQRMIQTFLLSVLIIAICMAMLGIKLLLRRDGKFSSQHVHDNPALRKKKIHCVIEQDREARNLYRNGRKD